ncbi:MAG: hypothetical protein FRX49_07246 [Trebouxia sp. A1-2]|nr:MAG: hypothetical protein FRX49_07246 [Trebouxia sp. A1-2]
MDTADMLGPIYAMLLTQTPTLIEDVQPAQAQVLQAQSHEAFLITTGSCSIIPKQQIWTSQVSPLTLNGISYKIG